MRLCISDEGDRNVGVRPFNASSSACAPRGRVGPWSFVEGPISDVTIRWCHRRLTTTSHTAATESKSGDPRHTECITNRACCLGFEWPTWRVGTTADVTICLLGVSFGFYHENLAPVQDRKLVRRPAAYRLQHGSCFSLGICKASLADRNVGRRYDLFAGSSAWVLQ